MNYYIRSFRTKSYWVYALWSVDSVKTFMAVVGGIWLFVDILSSFKLIDKEKLSLWSLAPIVIFGLIIVIITRRPVKKISYKYPGQDLRIEVCIGNLFDIPG